MNSWVSSSLRQQICLIKSKSSLSLAIFIFFSFLNFMNFYLNYFSSVKEIDDSFLLLVFSSQTENFLSAIFLMEEIPSDLLLTLMEEYCFM